MNNILFQWILNEIKKFVIAWLNSQGDKVVPKPDPKPDPEPDPPEDPNDDEDPVIDDPKPDTGTSPNEKLYIPRVTRQEWIDKIENAYSVWRGERDYAAILEQYPDVARRYLGDDLSRIGALLLLAQDSYARGKRLAWRVDNEIHRKFRDRSQVRKSVVNEMVAELRLRTAEHAEVNASFPDVKGCDNVTCKLKKLSQA